MGRMAFSCRSTGTNCEWAVEAETAAAVLARVAEHQKCAHHRPEASDTLRAEWTAALRAA